MVVSFCSRRLSVKPDVNREQNFKCFYFFIPSFSSIDKINLGYWIKLAREDPTINMFPIFYS